MPPKPLTEIFTDEPLKKRRRRKKRKAKPQPTYKEYLTPSVPVEERCPHSTKTSVLRTECSLCAGVQAVTVRPGPVVPLEFEDDDDSN